VLYGFSLESSFLWRQICTGEINFLTLVSKRSFVLHDLVLYGFSLESFSFFYGAKYFAFFLTGALWLLSRIILFFYGVKYFAVFSLLW
jgi:hypothetical protein